MRDGPLPACCARSLRIRTCFRAARRRALRRRRLDGRRIGEMDGGSACIAAVTIVNFSEVHASTCVVLVWCSVSFRGDYHAWRVVYNRLYFGLSRAACSDFAVKRMVDTCQVRAPHGARGRAARGVSRDDG